MSAGMGVYAFMGSRNHLGQGRAPAAISAYLRDLVDWPNQAVPLNPGRGPTGRLSPHPQVQTGRPGERVLHDREPLAT